MSDKFEALKAAADKYSVALKAHQETPKDFDVLVAWDTATSEINSLINNDEINIITALLAALEEKDQRIKELEGDVRFERLRLNEAEIAALIQRAEAAEQRLQQPALADVIAERQRQISAEGWTPEHDDQHTSSEMAGAAACYARHVNARGWVYSHNPDNYQCEPESSNWPWDASWWKPTNPRRDLVKAGALILAEIERLDRAAAKVEGE